MLAPSAEPPRDEPKQVAGQKPRNVAPPPLEEPEIRYRDILGKLLQHVWPKNDRSTKVRVVLALSLLLARAPCRRQPFHRRPPP